MRLARLTPYAAALRLGKKSLYRKLVRSRGRPPKDDALVAYLDAFLGSKPQKRDADCRKLGWV